LHDYVQEARILIAGISRTPIDLRTQVDVFLEGLNDGPVRRELFRIDLDSLEHAMQLALQEEFTLRESRSVVRGKPNRSSFGRARDDQMEVFGLDASRNEFAGRRSPSANASPSFDKANIVCWRCNSKGHFQSDCPKRAGGGASRRGGRATGYPRQGNGRSQ
jgi:hypothetical protein